MHRLAYKFLSGHLGCIITRCTFMSLKQVLTAPLPIERSATSASVTDPRRWLCKRMQVWQANESSLLNGHECRMWVKIAGLYRRSQISIWMKNSRLEVNISKQTIIHISIFLRGTKEILLSQSIIYFLKNPLLVFGSVVLNLGWGGPCQNKFTLYGNVLIF